MSSEIRGKKKRKARSQFGRVVSRPGRNPYIQFTPPDAARDPKTGRRKPVTRAVASEKEGKALLKEIRLAILRGTYAPSDPAAEPCELTLLQAVDEYLDVKRGEGRSPNGMNRYQTSRRAIERSPLARKRVVDLDPRDLEGYQAWRRVRCWRAVRKRGGNRTDPNVHLIVEGATVSNATVNRDLALIAAALNRLVRLGALEKSPVAQIKRGKEPVRTRAVLSKEECARLVEACDPHFRPLVLAALLTGARPCELMALTWGDVSLGNRTIMIYRSKVGLGDAVPMHPQLAAELKALKEQRAKAGQRIIPDDEAVFLSKRGRPNWDYRCAWRRAVAGAGLDRRKGLTFYSCRHSFATHFLERGAPSDLQQLLGHASYATSQRYARAVSDRARVGIEALALAGAGETRQDQPKSQEDPRKTHCAEVRGV